MRLWTCTLVRQLWNDISIFGILHFTFFSPFFGNNPIIQGDKSIDKVHVDKVGGYKNRQISGNMSKDQTYSIREQLSQNLFIQSCIEIATQEWNNLQEQQKVLIWLPKRMDGLENMLYIVCVALNDEKTLFYCFVTVPPNEGEQPGCTSCPLQGGSLYVPCF